MDRELTMTGPPVEQSSPDVPENVAAQPTSGDFDVLLALAGLARPDGHGASPATGLNAVLANRYGLTGTLHRLGSERDETYRLQSAGEALLVKVSAPDESSDTIGLQVAAIGHLGAGNSLAVPRIRATLDGAPTAVLARDDDSPDRFVHIMEFLRGDDLSGRTLSVRQAERVGQVHGELTGTLADFTHPHATRRLIWDLAELPAIAAALMGQLRDASHRRLAAEVLDRFERHVLTLVDQFDQQVVHGDYSVYNVLAEATDPNFVTGVVDFGDLHHGPVIFDLAIAVSNLLDHRLVDPWFLSAAHVRGFLGFQDVPQHHRAALAPAALARSLQRALLSQWRAAVQPGRAAYVLEHARDDWSNIAAGLETIRNADDHFVNPDQ